MKTISISEVTKLRLECLTGAQDYAVKKCEETCNGDFTDIALNIRVYAASHIRCAQSNLKNGEETMRRALSALVWLSKAAGVAEVCGSDARSYVLALSDDKTPVPDGIISAMSALAIFEARAYEATVSLQCDIEQ